MEGAQLCHLALFQGPRVAPPQEDVDRDGQVQLTANIKGYFAVSEDAMAEGVEILCRGSNPRVDVEVFGESLAEVST